MSNLDTLTLVVQGDVPFPIDMLRYSGCWPVSDDDSRAIMASLNPDNAGPDAELRHVALRRSVSAGHATRVYTSLPPDLGGGLVPPQCWESLYPGHKRWESYGWRVVAYGDTSVKHWARAIATLAREKAQAAAVERHDDDERDGAAT